MPFKRITFPTEMKIGIHLEEFQNNAQKLTPFVVRGFSDQKNQYA